MPMNRYSAAALLFAAGLFAGRLAPSLAPPPATPVKPAEPKVPEVGPVKMQGTTNPQPLSPNIEDLDCNAGEEPCPCWVVRAEREGYGHPTCEPDGSYPPDYPGHGTGETP